jgi:hypothetical protein
MSDTNEKREAIELCIALKKMPHLYAKIKNVWGFPDFFETVDGLMLMEPGREARAGLPEGVYKELDALKRVFVKFPNDVMPPYINIEDRRRVRRIVDEINARLLLSTGGAEHQG